MSHMRLRVYLMFNLHERGKYDVVSNVEDHLVWLAAASAPDGRGRKAVIPFLSLSLPLSLSLSPANR